MSERSHEEFVQRSREIGLDRAVWEEWKAQDDDRQARIDAALGIEGRPR